MFNYFIFSSFHLKVEYICRNGSRLKQEIWYLYMLMISNTKLVGLLTFIDLQRDKEPSVQSTMSMHATMNFYTSSSLSICTFMAQLFLEILLTKVKKSVR